REVTDRLGEAVRLRRALGDLGVPVDVVVLDEALAERRAKVPGSMVYEAMRHGRVVAQSWDGTPPRQGLLRDRDA
ncbi:MAG: hypothetical protein M3P50_06325, partial [Actinomycetota bacterium]|nr:hypothetical protein [Actinomycetota bacterium]